MFSMRSHTINVAFVQKDESHEESDDMNSSSEENDAMNSADESDELDDDGIILIAQRADLTTHEKNRSLCRRRGMDPLLGLRLA